MAMVLTPLEKRIQRLKRSGGSVIVDKNPISIQEYRSFIADELSRGQPRQPDHWAASDDPTHMAENPIVGIRPEDARCFCNWLTRKSAIKGTFRLPRQDEVDVADKNEVAPWVVVGDRIVIAANTQTQQRWEQEIRQQLHSGLDRDLARDFDLPLHRRVSKNTTRDTALERTRNRDQSSLLQQRLRERDTTLERIWSVSPDGFMDAGLRLKKALGRVCRKRRSLSHYYELARDLDRAIREANDLSLIRAYLLCVHTTWDCCCMDVQRNNVEASLLTKLQQEVMKSFDLYAFVAMVDQRRQGLLPCREILQLVFEPTT